MRSDDSWAAAGILTGTIFKALVVLKVFIFQARFNAENLPIRVEHFGEEHLHVGQPRILRKQSLPHFRSVARLHVLEMVSQASLVLEAKKAISFGQSGAKGAIWLAWGTLLVIQVEIRSPRTLEARAYALVAVLAAEHFTRLAAPFFSVQLKPWLTAEAEPWEGAG